MRTRVVPLLVTALSVTGLLVSLVAGWPGRDLADTVRAAPAAQAVWPSRPHAAPKPAATTDKRVRPGVAPPAYLRVSGTGLRARVRPVGVTTRNRQMELPDGPTVVGWYRHGPAPGVGRGAVVIAGHVDTIRRGLGVMARLRNAERGDTVAVLDRRGERRRYEVTRVAYLDRHALPARLFARTGAERLHLITCGGDYDADEGGYQENLVVTAHPV